MLTGIKGTVILVFATDGNNVAFLKKNYENVFIFSNITRIPRNNFQSRFTNDKWDIKDLKPGLIPNRR